jgi:hypothetical protein
VFCFSGESTCRRSISGFVPIIFVAFFLFFHLPFQGLRRGELLFPGDDVETKIAKQLERKGCSFAVTGEKK